jgi:hypothetical protein
MACTWKGCGNTAAHPQTSKSGEVWANLCDQHNAELEAALMGGSARRILSVWVLAAGGAKKMAERI